MLCSYDTEPFLHSAGPLISEDDRLYGIFISYFPNGLPSGMPVNGECLPPINRGNVFLNIAATVIYDDILKAMRDMIGAP